MYAKLENNKLTYAPRNYDTGANLILNFNKNEELMKKYGFKEVIDNKPEYDSNTHYIIVDKHTEDIDTITIDYKLNEIEMYNEPTLEDRVKELEKVNKEQDELINTTMLVTDEILTVLEPLLVDLLSNTSSSKIVDMYVAMVKRGLKDKDLNEVPLRYREQVKEIISESMNI